MKPSQYFASVLLGLAGFLALDQQAGDETYEVLVKDMLTTVDHITKSLLTIKDKETAEAVRPDLKKSAEKLVELHKKAAEWKQPNKEEKDRLAKEYAPKLEKAVKQFREAASKLKGIPGTEEAVAELGILKEKNDKEK